MDANEKRAFGHGMAVAAGIIMSCWGEDVYATEILNAAGYRSYQSLVDDGVDEYDLKLLAALFDDAPEQDDDE